MTTSARALGGAWLALVLITLSSLMIAESAVGGDLEPVVVIGGAAAKGAIILLWFMGARSFPVTWRLFFSAWLVTNVAVILGSHFIGQT